MNVTDVRQQKVDVWKEKKLWNQLILLLIREQVQEGAEWGRGAGSLMLINGRAGAEAVPLGCPTENIWGSFPA